MEKLSTQEDSQLSSQENSIFEGLNEEQKSAVLYDDGPLLIQAGVGTGKTETLMRKYAYLISKGVKPSNILCVTFTNKAAKEMVDRAGQFVGSSIIGDIWINTFHSISMKMLKENENFKLVGLQSDFHIIDLSDQMKILEDILEDKESIISEFQKILKEEQQIKDSKKKSWSKSSYLSAQSPIPYARIARSIEGFKDSCISSDQEMPKSLCKFDQAVFKLIYSQYQDYLQQNNLIDFGDMILYIIQIFSKSKEILNHYQSQFEYVLVDEVQDINHNQEEWLKILVSDKQKLTCVGDEDQLIYGFRGAVGHLMLNFTTIFPNSKIIKLEQNYRSTKKILKGANSLIEKNHNGKASKILRTQNEEGFDIQVKAYRNQEQEIIEICKQIKDIQITQQMSDLSHIAILTRTNKDAKAFEKQLILEGIPYELSPKVKKFLEKKEVKLALQFITILQKPSDNYALKMVIESLHGIGPKTVDNLMKFKVQTKSQNLYEAIKLLFAEECSKQEEEKESTQSTDEQESESMVQQDGINDAVKLNATQRELIAKLVEMMGQYQGTKDREMIKKFQTKMGFYEKLDIKQKANISVLFDILDKFNDFDEFITHLSLFTGELAVKGDQNGVKIMTMHSVKGLEFDKVFLPFWTEWNLPNMMNCDDFNEREERVKEERRLAFVGITRAKKFVQISYYSINQWNRSEKQSRFISDTKQVYI